MSHNSGISAMWSMATILLTQPALRAFIAFAVAASGSDKRRAVICHIYSGASLR